VSALVRRVGARERRGRGTALGAANAVRAAALDDRRLILRAALRAHLRAVRIAVQAALDPRSLPEDVAREPTTIECMRIAIASPTSAPSTFTASVTS